MKTVGMFRCSIKPCTGSYPRRGPNFSLGQSADRDHSDSVACSLPSHSVDCTGGCIYIHCKAEVQLRHSCSVVSSKHTGFSSPDSIRSRSDVPQLYANAWDHATTRNCAATIFPSLRVFMWLLPSTSEANRRYTAADCRYCPVIALTTLAGYV